MQLHNKSGDFHCFRWTISIKFGMQAEYTYNIMYVLLKKLQFKSHNLSIYVCIKKK